MGPALCYPMGTDVFMAESSDTVRGCSPALFEDFSLFSGHWTSVDGEFARTLISNQTAKPPGTAFKGEAHIHHLSYRDRPLHPCLQKLWGA